MANASKFRRKNLRLRRRTFVHFSLGLRPIIIALNLSCRKGNILIAFKGGVTESEIKEIGRKLGLPIIEIVSQPGNLYSVKVPEGTEESWVKSINSIRYAELNHVLGIDPTIRDIQLLYHPTPYTPAEVKILGNFLTSSQLNEDNTHAWIEEKEDGSKELIAQVWAIRTPCYALELKQSAVPAITTELHLDVSFKVKSLTCKLVQLPIFARYTEPSTGGRTKVVFHDKEKIIETVQLDITE